MSEAQLPAFESIKTQLFPFMHDQIAGLHGWAAERTVAHLLKNSADHQLCDLRTVHTGAGFGGDMQEAFRQGICKRMGLEKDPLQISLADFLRIVTEKELRDLLENDAVVKTLYPAPYIEKVAKNYCEARTRNDPQPLDIRQCDVRDKEQLTQRLGPYAGMFNGMIGSIMMHWLVQGGFPLEQALDTLGELLAPSSIAVFSVPFHFTELEDLAEDEHLRMQCMPDTEFYRVFTETAVRQLTHTFGEIPQGPFRKVPSLLMKEADLKAGSELMQFVDLSREWSDRTVSIDLAMTGFGTYESALRTRQPAAKVAPFVVEAVETAKAAVGITETAGTFVTYYIYRRSQAVNR
jgi:hypothetical protein